jgi:hypothetical protein
MPLIGKMIGVGERLPIPDKITRAVIASLVDRTARKMRAANPMATGRSPKRWWLIPSL